MGFDGAVNPFTQPPTPKPLRLVKAGYSLSWIASLLAWTMCAEFSLATHATLTLPWVHNYLCIAQALTPMPILFAVCTTLTQASKLGWDALGKPQVHGPTPSTPPPAQSSTTHPSGWQ